MTRPDLFAVFFGKDLYKDEREKAQGGPTLARVLCPCGGIIASIHEYNNVAWVAVAGTRLTRPTTAENIIEFALMDTEYLCSKVDVAGEQTAEIERALAVLEGLFGVEVDDDNLKASIAEVLPPLKLPGRVIPLDALNSWHEDESLHSRSNGTVPNRVAGTSPTCNQCRKVWNIESDVLSWYETPLSHRQEIVFANHEQKEFLAKRLFGIYDESRAKTLRSRLSFYAWLTGVLRYEHTVR